MNNLFDLNNVLGKIVFLILILIATHFHLLAGILVLLFIISMNQSTVEGMENNEDSNNVDNSGDNNFDSSKESPISLFRKNNCKSGFLMKDDKYVTPDTLKQSFPNIKFSGDDCNPCDTSCDFEIISSAEQITVEENLRAQDSNSLPVDKEQVTKSGFTPASGRR